VNVILLSSVLNYRTLAGLSSKYRVHYLLPEQDMPQMELELRELDRLSSVHRRNLVVYPLGRFFVFGAFLKAFRLIGKGDVDLFFTAAPVLGFICRFFKVFYGKP